MPVTGKTALGSMDGAKNSLTTGWPLIIVYGETDGVKEVKVGLVSRWVPDGSGRIPDKTTSWWLPAERFTWQPIRLFPGEMRALRYDMFNYMIVPT